MVRLRVRIEYKKVGLVGAMMIRVDSRQYLNHRDDYPVEATGISGGQSKSTHHHPIAGIAHAVGSAGHCLPGSSEQTQAFYVG